jgi:hypothetical protein
VFLLNSRLGLFAETSLRFPFSKKWSRRWHPFSRSYGVILPSSLVKVISTPEHSQPAYLCRFTVRSLFRSLEVISCQWRIDRIHLSVTIDAPITPQDNDLADLPTTSPSNALHDIHTSCQPILLRHSIAQTLKAVQEYLTCFPSPTPIGLGLGID